MRRKPLGQGHTIPVQTRHDLDLRAGVWRASVMTILENDEAHSS